MPGNYLKIDGHFVYDIVTNEVNYAMVDAIHKVARVMDLETIGECVEDEAILEKLEEIGITYAQGYGIEKPYPINKLLSKRV
jgi:EAL domain-containing protein (putative c-di-GMP-specific phosphodiesterase class I)